MAEYHNMPVKQRLHDPIKAKPLGVIRIGCPVVKEEHQAHHRRTSLSALGV